MRVLVTGGTGFVGKHLVRELRSRGNDTVVAGVTSHPDDEMVFNLSNLDSIRAVVERSQPDLVFHLAAHASVADAVRDPLETYRANVTGTANVMEIIRTVAPHVRVVYASSGEVYGVHPAAEMPLTERTLPSPASIYAASKFAAESIVIASARTFGTRAVVVRPFNLVGPGQSDHFVVSAFAHRLAKIAGGEPPLFPVGNLSAQRDFLDVRDAVRALVDLAERGVDGEIYNVCSGRPTSVADILRQLVFAARVGVEIREDPAMMRPVDVPVAYGDNTKLRAATGWEPSYALKTTLRDTYADAIADREIRAFVRESEHAHGL